jgi:flavin-dependent dehydrogenase
VIWDVAIAGAGPAGLATAIGAAQAGLSVVVLERESLPYDKACGEGLMPTGVAALEGLGVTLAGQAIEGIRYVQEDGRGVEGRLRRAGLGVRREQLSRALRARAEATGVRIRERCTLVGHRRLGDRVELELRDERLRARVLVAADGLHSPIRRREALDVPLRSERFGFRQHFACAPWSSFVEVHLSPGAEAYVTPVGPEELGVAMLFSKPEAQLRANWRERFPVLAGRLGAAPQVSPTRGAGPFRVASRRVIADRLALVGDAAGYVDAITGEGVSIALSLAVALASCLPDAVRTGSMDSLAPYERAWRRAFRHYAFFANALVSIAARPRLRRGVLGLLARTPALFEMLLHAAVSPVQPEPFGYAQGSLRSDAPESKAQRIRVTGSRIE